MIDMKNLALNRIVAPGLDLKSFFRLARSAGIEKVELRNDLPGGRVLDGIDPVEASRMALDAGVRIISINALQKFNLSAVKMQVESDLDSLLAAAIPLACPAIVLCPNNEASDARSPESRYAETVEALRRLGSRFEDAGLLACVEPLGFGISSLDSLLVAARAIEESGHSCYRVLVDTFHNFLGPDGTSVLGTLLPVSMVGLVHVSAVIDDIPPEDYTDAHRVLPCAEDRMHSDKVIRSLFQAGYSGDVSFEPFSPLVQALPVGELEELLEASITYLTSL